jgi:hypothetical protein
MTVVPGYMNSHFICALLFFDNITSPMAKKFFPITFQSTVIPTTRIHGKNQTSCVLIDSPPFGHTYVCSSTALDLVNLSKSLNNEIEWLKNCIPKPKTNSVSKKTSPTTTSESSVASMLETANKALPPFFGPRSVICSEFWHQWRNSIPLEIGDLQFFMAISSDLTLRKWTVMGNYSLYGDPFIDFFRSAGAQKDQFDSLSLAVQKVKPSSVGYWVYLSDAGVMSGGWTFSGKMKLKGTTFIYDEGESKEVLMTWLHKHTISSCSYVCREMGIEPPYLTEICVTLNEENFEKKYHLVQKACHSFGFPEFPIGILNVIRKWNPESLRLSFLMSPSDIIRISIIVPTPHKSIAALKPFIGNALAKCQKDSKIEPFSLELQYTKRAFDFKEGLQIVFHYCLQKNDLLSICK